MQIRREGIIYSALSYAERKIHSPLLFSYLNRRNIISNFNEPVLMSVAVTRYTRVKQILHLIKRMRDNECVILMFHSIIDKNACGYGSDNWFFDIAKFEDLCRELNDLDVSVRTTQYMIQKRG